MYLAYVRDEKHCRELWAALPVKLSGESYKEYEALYRLAKRQGWTLPRRPGRVKKEMSPWKRMAYAEWLILWDGLGVPVGDVPLYQRLRRLAKKRGWDIPARINPGQEAIKALNEERHHRALPD